MLVTALVAIVALVVVSATLPGAVAAAKAAVFPKPAVSIQTSAAGQSVGTGESITFTAQRTSGNELSYSWSFTDSNGGSIQDSAGNPLVASGETISESFSQFGTIGVNLTATDPTGQTATASVNVSILPPPPTAAFTSYTSYAFPGYCYVTFDGSGSSSPAGSITNYAWNFGDGSTDSSSYNSSDYHLYSGAGTYTVTLVVTDQYQQNSAPASQTVSVSC
jgi:PKD repeat protein